MDDAQPIAIKKVEPGEGEQLGIEHVNLRAHTTLDVQLEDKEKISAGFKKLF